MKIQEALKETGMAKLSDPDQLAEYVTLVDNPDGFGRLIHWFSKDGEDLGEVLFAEIMSDLWLPYHKEPEIRPEKAGELWEDQYGDTWFTYSINKGEIGRFNNGYMLDIDKTIIHGKNKWTRLYPPVPNPNIERIEIEKVRWFRDGATSAVPIGGPFEWDRVVNKTTKLILEIPKEPDKCMHGKNTNEYCEPCGRIHGS